MAGPKYRMKCAYEQGVFYGLYHSPFLEYMSFGVSSNTDCVSYGLRWYLECFEEWGGWGLGGGAPQILNIPYHPARGNSIQLSFLYLYAYHPPQ